MHLNHGTFSIVVGEILSVQSCTSYNQFQSPLPIDDCFFDQCKKNVSVQRSLVSFIEDDNMIFEKIRICYTLPDEYTIGYISQFSRWACLIIKSNRITCLLSQASSSFKRYSIGHTDCGHSSRLSYDNVDIFDRLLFAIFILFYFVLILYYTVPYHI